jgi:hypothetical protein
MARWRRRRGGIGAALNKSCRIYGGDDDTLFRLIAIGNAKVWVDSPSPSHPNG